MWPIEIVAPTFSSRVSIVQDVLVLLSIARFAGSVYRFYPLWWASRISVEEIFAGNVDSKRLASSGLANRLSNESLRRKRGDSGIALNEADRGELSYTIDVAEHRSSYLGERCQSDVDSARRAAALVFLLSLIAVAYTACPRYLLYYKNNTTIASGAAFLTVRDMFTILGSGLSLCAVLYVASSFFQRALAKRRASWNYFSAMLKDELQRRPI
jgi:hypothetical protein